LAAEVTAEAAQQYMSIRLDELLPPLRFIIFLVVT
jgi:hypothetical protein